MIPRAKIRIDDLNFIFAYTSKNLICTINKAKNCIIKVLQLTINHKKCISMFVLSFELIWHYKMLENALTCSQKDSFTKTVLTILLPIFNDKIAKRKCSYFEPKMPKYWNWNISNVAGISSWLSKWVRKFCIDPQKS